MTPADLAQLRDQGVITHAEHDVLHLRHKGLSHRTIAQALDISRWAVRDREWNGNRKIERHRRKDAAA